MSAINNEKLLMLKKVLHSNNIYVTKFKNFLGKLTISVVVFHDDLVEIIDNFKIESWILPHLVKYTSSESIPEYTSSSRVYLNDVKQCLENASTKVNYESIISFNLADDKGVIKSSDDAQLKKVVTGALIFGSIGALTAVISNRRKKVLYTIRLNLKSINQPYEEITCSDSKTILSILNALAIKERELKENVVPLSTINSKREDYVQNIYDKLIKANELLEKGIITEDEFQAIKDKVILE
jgi:hypothetical protein